MNDCAWSRLSWIAAWTGSAFYAAGLLLFVRAGAGGGSLVARAAAHPGWWGIAYLLHGVADLLWCLVPLAVWDRMRRSVPNLALLSALAGVAGFFWMAQLALARSGGLAFLGALYSSGSPAQQGLAAQLAQWQQFWVFGGSWEVVADILVFGAWLGLSGGMIARLLQEAGGKILVMVALIATISLFAGLVLRLSLRLSYRPVAASISFPGSVIALVAPLWLLWVAWALRSTMPGAAPSA